MPIEIVRTIVEDDKSLLLRRDGQKLELVLGNVVLLSSAALETALELGRLAREPIERAAGGACVLGGGLGFGATLRGVLDVARSDTKVIVVEKLRTVMEIARSEAAELVGGALDDPRVELRAADVADVIAEVQPGSLSAILLDVDNGPQALSQAKNQRLYGDAGTRACWNALTPGGVLGVWSAGPNAKYAARLGRFGFETEVLRVAARTGGRASHVLFLGTKPTR